MKRAAAAKSCGWIVSGRSKDAGSQQSPLAQRAANHEFVCDAGSIGLPPDDNELRQYRQANARL